MEIKGFGSVVQADKTKTPYNCRKWLLQVKTDKGRKSKRFNGSKREAQQELSNFITELENAQYIKSKNFEEYVAYYLDYRNKSKRYSPNTLLTDKRCSERLVDMFGAINLDDLTPKLIRDSFCFIGQLENPEVDLSGTMKRKIFFTLSSILNMAIDDELLEINPCTKVIPPKRDTKEKKALTQKELKDVLLALDSEPLDGKIMFIYFMLLLGLRRGEAAALKWEDWDKWNNTISIKRAYIVANRSIGPPKSKAGYRTLPIPSKLLKILQKWEEICTQAKIDCEWICCSSYGTLLIGGACYKWWKRFKIKHDLVDISYHELRHTNLTIVARHLSPFDLKDYAGWCDLEPATIYIHKNQESLKNGINKINYEI